MIYTKGKPLLYVQSEKQVVSHLFTIKKKKKRTQELYTKNTNNLINKWAKELISHCTEEDIQEMNRYMKNVQHL